MHNVLILGCGNIAGNIDNFAQADAARMAALQNQQGVAQAVPQKAQAVADRLISSGSNDAAAKLLPTLFADRLEGGYFSYVGAALELADCEGEKTAIIHYNIIKESGTVWGVQSQAEAQWSNWKPKLKKCSKEGDSWIALSTPDPTIDSGEDWLKKVEKQQIIFQIFKLQTTKVLKKKNLLRISN